MNSMVDKDGSIKNKKIRGSIFVPAERVLKLFSCLSDDKEFPPGKECSLGLFTWRQREMTRSGGILKLPFKTASREI